MLPLVPRWAAALRWRAQPWVLPSLSLSVPTLALMLGLMLGTSSDTEVGAMKRLGCEGGTAWETALGTASRRRSMTMSAMRSAVSLENKLAVASGTVSVTASRSTSAKARASEQ